MPIHVYADKNQRRLICVLDFELIQKMEPVWLLLRQKAGLVISEYDDAILYGSHSELLHSAVEKVTSLSTEKEVSKLLVAFAGCDKSSAIYFVGE